MKKQTAVSIIIENFNLLSDYDFKIWFLNSMEKLEALEKEQIMEAFINGSCDCQKLLMDSDVKQYYNETYNK